MHPPRSLLYVPASNARALAKAASLDADAVIVDLEDSVAPQAKDAAREAMRAALAAGFSDKPTIVRVNALGTAWLDADLAAAVAARPHAVLVPKIDTAAQATTLVARTAGVPIWLMIETPGAVLVAASLATVPGVAAFVLGLNDLAATLRATPGPDRAELLPHIARILLAARAGGIAAFDGVPMALTDVAIVAAEAEQAARFGFDGKTLIHPAQIAPVNNAFTPNAAVAEQARALLIAWNARAPGAGVAVHQGRLIEAMHADTARRTLARAGLGG